jgi:hypothetical protein
MSMAPEGRFTVQGVTMQYEQIPSRATFTKYPTPEMVRNVVDTRTNSPSHGQTIPVAFYHPSTATTDEWLDEFSKGNVTFAFELDRGKTGDSLNQETRKEDSVSAYERLKEDNPDVYNDSIP